MAKHETGEKKRGSFWDVVFLVGAAALVLAGIDAVTDRE